LILSAGHSSGSVGNPTSDAVIRSRKRNTRFGASRLQINDCVGIPGN